MRRAIAVALAACALVAGCALPPPAREGVQAPVPAGTHGAREALPAGFPDAWYRGAQARGEAVYRVDPARSRVVIEVRRAGSLARLGHDHVVASHDTRGYVAPRSGRADLYVRLADLVVDEAALRKEAGFDTTPSAADVAGTRDNMLHKVLDADAHPDVLIAVTRAADGALDVALTLHGATHGARIADADVRIEGDEIAAHGRLAIAQTDFGIVPFTILGGAIAVQDRLAIRFDIRAQRITAGD
jgi:YceI-like domain